MSSLRLFKVAMCGLDIIKNFSEMHELHRLVRVVYALAFARIFHVIVKSFFFSFNCHRYLLSSMSFFLFSCLNDIWWFLHCGLEFCGSQAYICLGFFLGCDLGLVHDFFKQAFTF